MVRETESEREKKRRRSDHNTKREQTSPKQELKKQQSNHSDLLPVSISPKVPAIEKREEMIPKQEAKQKVRRTSWDQPPESISLHAGKTTISEEAATDLSSGKPTVPEEAATKNVVLTDMFDPKKIEEKPELYLDIQDEVQEECCKIGAVVDAINFDRKSGGLCVRFNNKRSAAVAKNKFHGWERCGKSITATYLEEERYRKRYGL